MELDPHLFGEGSACFGCAPEHPIGFRMRFTREEDETVRTRFLPTERYQGPPGLMHGGLVMTLADEIGAWTVVGLLGKFGFTAAASCRLSRPVRVGEEVLGVGRITRPGTRVVHVGVTLEQAGEAAFAGDFTFALVDEKAAEKMLGGPLPEAWRRFSR